MDKKQLISYYQNLPKNIKICIGKKCYSGQELAEEIKKGTEIGKLIIDIHKLYEKKMVVKNAKTRKN